MTGPAQRLHFQPFQPSAQMCTVAVQGFGKTSPFPGPAFCLESNEDKESQLPRTPNTGESRGRNLSDRGPGDLLEVSCQPRTGRLPVPGTCLNTRGHGSVTSSEEQVPTHPGFLGLPLTQTAPHSSQSWEGPGGTTVHLGYI